MQLWNFQEQIVLFRNKQRHGIIRPQSDKLNHYTGTGCEIYSQLMIKVQQILHCCHSSVFLDAFKNIRHLVNLFVFLPLKINSKSEKFGNNDDINHRD